MKNINNKPILPLMLLAIVLIANVGLHVFHFHDRSTKYSSEFSSIPNFELVHELDSECLLCNLDSFQDLNIYSFELHSLPLTINEAFVWFFISPSDTKIFFSKGRAPPSPSC